MTIMQFREHLADRQAAEAVRARIDWNRWVNEFAPFYWSFAIIPSICILSMRMWTAWCGG
jgi:hypothetical protein